MKVLYNYKAKSCLFGLTSGLCGERDGTGLTFTLVLLPEPSVWFLPRRARTNPHAVEPRVRATTAQRGKARPEMQVIAV